MNSGCSAVTGSGGQSADCWSMISRNQMSRPSVQPISFSARCSTTTFSTVAQPSLRARSTLAFSGTVLPPRMPPSAVMTALAPASSMRSFRASAEKPPNTTEWVAPIRAQACMATTASGTMGM